MGTVESTTRSNLFTVALPSEFDQLDPQPPPVRRTQELMRRVRVALPSVPLQGCRNIDSQDHLLFNRSWMHPLICWCCGCSRSRNSRAAAGWC